MRKRWLFVPSKIQRGGPLAHSFFGPPQNEQAFIFWAAPLSLLSKNLFPGNLFLPFISLEIHVLRLESLIQMPHRPPHPPKSFSPSFSLPGGGTQNTSSNPAAFPLQPTPLHLEWDHLFPPPKPTPAPGLARSHHSSLLLALSSLCSCLAIGRDSLSSQSAPASAFCSGPSLREWRK